MLHIPKSLMSACQGRTDFNHLVVYKDQPVVTTFLLLAIAGCETAFGQQADFVRAEPAYMPGGRYFEDSASLKLLYRQYGVAACSSWGPFQIMFIVAREVGFKGHPWELVQEETGARVALEVIRRSVKIGSDTLEKVLDAYNSGNSKDANVPFEYVRKGVTIYEQLLLDRYEVL
jgi:hypothetical protein